ncbi:diguanylate cyclase [Xanthobacter sp. KR7-65]|uniref:GGDEF domain-containing protein n=1 Tax=Xanthobacter sp. KR7-65 TaxID=3156612 RepID=UPI0032B5A87A
MNSLLPARILIIDDDVGTIRWLSAAVKGMAEVFFATSGDAGIAMARSRAPDLILLDAEMPDLDGFAVCRILKSDPAFSDVPIIFVTAHSDPHIEEAALDLGAVDFITKPSSAAIVKARVRSHLALKQKTDELRRLATVDPLTGASNRRAMDACLSTEWRRACRSRSNLALILVDVDHFKRFNDHYGHQAGDECLRATAAALMRTVRRPGEMVARYGGEEFAVILPDCDEANALRMAERLRQAVIALHIPHAGSETEPRVTVSLGIAGGPSDWGQIVFTSVGESEPEGDIAMSKRGPEQLIAAADLALYAAKRQGRNQAALRRWSDRSAEKAPLQFSQAKK